MDVEPKIRGVHTPKWMVKIMEPPIKMAHDLGVFPYFWKHPYRDSILNLYPQQLSLG